MSPALIEALIVLAAKYGPGVITGIKAALTKKDVTIEDIEALFANVHPYEYFNIPATVPAKL